MYLPSLRDQSIACWCGWDVLGPLSKNILSLFMQSCLPFTTVLEDLCLKWFLGHLVEAIRAVIKPSSTPDTVLCGIHLSFAYGSTRSKGGVLVHTIILVIRTFISITKIIT